MDDAQERRNRGGRCVSRLMIDHGEGREVVFPVFISPCLDGT
jgi:hypothetical protein